MNIKDQVIKVLCVEDNEIYNIVLKSNLEQNRDYNFQIKQVYSMSETVNALRTSRYDIILLDLGLPDSDGLNTLLHVSRASSSTPIIILTASNEEGLVTSLLRRGAQDYIWKEELDSKLLVKSIIYSIERKKFEVELLETTNRLKFHMENSPLAVIELNDNFQILKWSPQANKLFNQGKDQVLGKKISDIGLMDDSEWEKFESNIQQLFYGSLSKSVIHIRMNGQDGKIIYTECYITIIFNDDGKADSILCLINDITAKEAEETSVSLGQEMERKRVAREIHDGVGQLLVAVKYAINQLETEVDEETQKKLENIDGMLGKAISEARSISLNIAERNVTNISIEAQGRLLCENIKKLTGINIKFNYIEQTPCEKNHILYNLYRILQEILNNIVKHSGATQVNIQLFLGFRNIELKAVDNGYGYNIEKTLKTGRGLKNIEERVSSLQGTFQNYSEEGKGTIIIIRVPI